MTCPEAPVLSAYVDGELAPAESEAVRAHLAACADCARVQGAERALAARVARSGRTAAPEALRRRVETIVSGAREAGPRRGLGWALPLIGAAAAVALLLLVPPAPKDSIAAALVADHAAHAASDPSGRPFPSGADPPAIAWPEDARVEGLSECEVSGEFYAHWVIESGGALVSVYIPLGPPSPGGRRRIRAGGAAVVPLHGDRGVEAFLVSSDLSIDELASRWGG